MNEVDCIVKQIITELRSVETDTVKLGDEVHFEINLTNAGLCPSDNIDANIKFTYQVNDPKNKNNELTGGVKIVI